MHRASLTLNGERNPTHRTHERTQDGKVFEKDETLIAKNSTLIIVRKPLPKGQQKVWEEEEKIAASSVNAMTAAAAGFGIGASDADMTEDDKIRDDVTQFLGGLS